MNGFIETDGRVDLFLKFGVIDHVFVVQWLLEHHQVVLIHLLERVDVRQRVRRVRITHEWYVWKSCAHLANDFDVPSRLNLDFDATVAGFHFRVDLLQQFVDRWLNSNRDTTVDALSRSSQQFPKLNAFQLGLKVP